MLTYCCVLVFHTKWNASEGKAKTQQRDHINGVVHSARDRREAHSQYALLSTVHFGIMDYFNY